MGLSERGRVSKRAGAAWIAVLVLTAVGIGVAFWPRDDGLTPAEVSAVVGSLHQTITYEVEGAGGASRAALTATTPTGTEQATTALPLKQKDGRAGATYDFPAGTFVYLSAQNQGEAGTVTCRIRRGDVVISENTSSGPYAIATCQGSA